jgi:O-antigen/teichoic acid export membrane protein
MILFDLGINNSLIKYVSQYRSLNNQSDIRKYVGTSLTIYFVIGLLVCITIIASSGFLVSSLLTIDPDFQPVAKVAFQIAGIGFLAGQMGGVYRGVLFGYKRYDLVSALGIILGTVRVFGTVLILWYGLTLIEVVAFNLTVGIFDLFLKMYLSSRFVPGIRPGFNATAAKDMLNLGLMMLVSQMAGIFLLQFDRTFIGIILGASSVTYYAVVDNLARQMHGVTQSATLSVFPVTSEMSSVGSHSKIKTLYFRGTKWSVIISTSITSLLTAVAYKFLLFWLGPEFAATSTRIMQILLISYCFTAFTAVSYFVVDGLGLSRYNAVFAVSTASINVLGCLFLVPSIGLIGAAIANILVSAVIPVYIFTVERQILRLDSLDHFGEVYIRPIVVAIVTFSIVYFIQLRWGESLLQLGIILGCGGVFYLGLAYISRVFSDEDIELFKIYVAFFYNQGKRLMK